MLTFRFLLWCARTWNPTCCLKSLACARFNRKVLNIPKSIYSSKWKSINCCRHILQVNFDFFYLCINLLSGHRLVKLIYKLTKWKKKTILWNQNDKLRLLENSSECIKAVNCENWGPKILDCIFVWFYQSSWIAFKNDYL